MKTSHSLLFFAVAALFAMSVTARAEDPIPPKPPGPATLPPAAPAATTPPASTSEPAAPAPGAERKGRGSEFVQMLREKIGITNEQLEKMKPIFGQEMEKMKGLKEDTGLSMQQKREKALGIMAGTMEEIKPILTPEQLAKFKEEMEKRRAARQQKQ